MRKRLFSAILVCAIATVSLIAQNKFAEAYLQGEAAFKDGDYAKAEPLLRASISSPDTPKNRGRGVPLVGQQRDFYPELYLALIYARDQRYNDVLKYAALARKYIKRNGDPNDVYLAGAENEAKKAVASGTKDDTRGVKLVARPAAEGAGKMYALVIGNQRYQDSAFKTLETPITDATEVRDLLRDSFGFETELLKDAKRSDIMTALEKHGRRADESASVLIYYGGHGVLDPDNGKAYWIPNDANETSRTNWVSSGDITDTIRAFRARHVLVISDSCYAGALTREGLTGVSMADDHNVYVERAARSKSRTLLASGGEEPVSDAGGGGNHSIFAASLLRGLNSIESAQFTAQDLFQKIAARVAGGSQQLPQYSPIRDSGHVDGDFVFYRRK